MKTIAALLLMAGALSAQDGFRVKVVGTGKPMILIPGLSSSGEVWDTTVARYKDRSSATSSLSPVSLVCHGCRPRSSIVCVIPSWTTSARKSW
jgi:hypothetical protein